jgi:hypothetical protein
MGILEFVVVLALSLFVALNATANTPKEYKPALFTVVFLLCMCVSSFVVVIMLESEYMMGGIPITGVILRNMWHACVYASVSDANGGLSHTSVMTRLLMKNDMSELHTPYGVLCGKDAFRGVESIFGKKDTTSIKRLLYGTEMVECSIHGLQRGDFGHVFPRSLGGVMRLEHKSMNGYWFELQQVMPHNNADNLRLVNTVLECSICNRIKREQVSHDAQLYLSNLPIVINGKIYEGFKVS